MSRLRDRIVQLGDNLLRGLDAVIDRLAPDKPAKPTPWVLYDEDALRAAGMSELEILALRDGLVRVPDAEDHGPEPTSIEQRIIDGLRNLPEPEVTPQMRDRAIARFAAEVAAQRGRPAADVWEPLRRPTYTRLDHLLTQATTVDQQLAVLDEMDLDLPPQARCDLRRRVRAGERLADLIAPNRTPIAPYDERADETGGSKRYHDYLES